MGWEGESRMGWPLMSRESHRGLRYHPQKTFGQNAAVWLVLDNTMCSCHRSYRPSLDPPLTLGVS